MLRVIRRRLPLRLRQKFDSEDFLQAVWASVFARPSRLAECQDQDDFVAYLAGIASNKVRMEIRRRIHTQKYDVRRERSMDDSSLPSSSDAPSPDATPSQIAIARERWSQILADRPLHHQKIVELRYKGLSIREISRRLDMHEGSVQRVLREIFREL